MAGGLFYITRVPSFEATYNPVNLLRLYFLFVATLIYSHPTVNSSGSLLI